MLVDHVFKGERLQAFSDAVFAIIATIMVIPLKLDEATVEAKGGIDGFDLEDGLLKQYPNYLVYIFSFIVVVDVWYSHVRIFSIIEQVDDVILWLNLMLLLFVSFLPFGIGLLNRFQRTEPEGFVLAIIIASLDLILIGATMIIILVYAFRKQALLHPEISNSRELRSIKHSMYITLAVNPTLAFLALVFSFLPTSVVSLTFFYGIGSATAVVRLALLLYHKIRRADLPDHVVALFRTVANRVRTEAFSDGIFSIVATLVVLDLTSGDIPTVMDLKINYNNSLSDALLDEKYVFVAYVATFVLVGLLWFVQYGMFQFIREVTPALSVVNTVTLLLVGVLPFVASVNTMFATSLNSDNEILSIRVVAVVVFLLGLSQLVLWTIALLTKEQCLIEEVDKYPAEILQFFKIMVFPAVSFIIFWATFSSQVTAHHVYASVTFTTPFLFLLLKIVFQVHEKYRTAARMRMAQLLPGVGAERSLLLQGGARRSRRVPTAIPSDNKPHELVSENSRSEMSMSTST